METGLWYAWAALDVDYEMYSKIIYQTVKSIVAYVKFLGGKVPIQFFLNYSWMKKGSKISKIKGNSISVDEWLHYAPLEV